jgi:hypothetical protein
MVIKQEKAEDIQRKWCHHWISSDWSHCGVLVQEGVNSLVVRLVEVDLPDLNYLAVILLLSCCYLAGTDDRFVQLGTNLSSVNRPHCKRYKQHNLHFQNL